MIKQRQFDLFEDFGPVNLELTDFFFGEKTVKINTFVSKEGLDQKFPVCYEMNKEELYDFILEAENYKEVLEENGEFDRLIMGKDGDVISLRTRPLIIINIYLDLKIEIIGSDIEDPTKGTTNLTIVNYYKKS